MRSVLEHHPDERKSLLVAILLYLRIVIYHTIKFNRAKLFGHPVFTEPDSAVFAFEASSSTLLKVSRVGLKRGNLRAERNFRLVVRS